MVAAHEFHDLVSSGIASGRPDCTHNSFGTGIYHTYHINGRNDTRDQLCHLHFFFRGCTVAQTLLTGLDHSFPDQGMIVSQDHRSPGIDKIQIFVSIHIIQISAVGVVDETGTAADGTESPDRTVDSAGNELHCFFKKFF